MKILAIETSTEACSAALLIDGHTAEEFQVVPRGHAELILAMVDRLLAQAALRPADLDAVAFGRGPGAFTGLRIATGVVQGIAFAAELPVSPVSTLAAIAQGAYRERGATRVLAAIDARMQEVYFGPFVVESGLMVAAGEEVVSPPERVPRPEGEGWHGAGTGWGTYREPLMARLGSAVTSSEGERLPHAADVAALAVREVSRGNVVAAELAMPVYLRDQVVQRR